jgi:hypothetical protein
MLLVNTTANDAWGDLPRRRSFVPLVDRLLEHLSGDADGTGGPVRVGQPARLPLPRAEPGQVVRLIGPRGNRRSLRVAGPTAQPGVELRGLVQPGVYELRWTRDPLEPPSIRRFVAQAGPGESELSKPEPEDLTAWWAPIGVETQRVEPPLRLSDPGGRVPLLSYALLLAVAAMAFEMYLAHRACPRMNPPIATGSAVARRGFFGEPRQASPPRAGSPHTATPDSVEA